MYTSLAQGSCAGTTHPPVRTPAMGDTAEMITSLLDFLYSDFRPLTDESIILWGVKLLAEGQLGDNTGPPGGDTVTD